MQQPFQITGDDIDFNIYPGAGLIILEHRFLLGMRYDINVKTVVRDAVDRKAGAVYRHSEARSGNPAGEAYSGWRPR